MRYQAIKIYIDFVDTGRSANGQKGTFKLHIFRAINMATSI